jgi:hypothetical protein
MYHLGDQEGGCGEGIPVGSPHNIEGERDREREREQGRCLGEFTLQANIDLGQDLASLI